MIQFVNVTKSYDTKESDLVAVENVSFEIEDGEFVFLIGPSGSGKTTLIKMLIREERPTSGKVYFDNEDVTVFNRSQIYDLRRKIGVIFQDYKLIEDKTAYENIEFVMEAAGKSEQEIKETVPYLLDIVGLADRSNSFPRELSGGEKQRIAIARALANNPKVLIADEPTGNLDPDAAWEVVQILKKVNDWGTTVIMSTHGSDIVDKINRRVLQMDNGVLVRDENIGQYKTLSEENKKDFEKSLLERKEEEEKEHEEQIDKETKQEKDLPEEQKTTEELKQEVQEQPQEELQEKEVIKDEDEGDKDTEESKVQTEEKKEDEKVTEEIEADEQKEKEVEEEQKKEQVDNQNEKISSDDEKEVEKEEKPPKKENKKFKISLVHKKGKEKVVEKKKPKKSEEQPIYTLNLPPKLVDILEANGYQDVEKLVNAGIEKVSKIKELDDTDIEIIRKSIVNFIQSE